METNKTKIEDDIKENKLINSTLRYLLFLTLCLFLSSLYYNGMQQRLNRVLRTKTDSVIIRSYEIIKEKNKLIDIMKFRTMSKSVQTKEIRMQLKKRLKNGNSRKNIRRLLK